MELLPLAFVITPNIPEAERLVGFSITKEADMRRAAEEIRALGARAVLIKGGHLGGRRQEPGELREAIDVLLDEAGKFTVFREQFVDLGDVHGSGCTLSAAIAACLAKQMNLEEAVGAAKSFVTEAIRAAPQMGRGARPL
jgi:hydroxymethylpyrimidine kinase/phosphomethylpyrimidine kinase